MSKVVHLSESAHQRAKLRCQAHGQSMSDWVAELIASAIATEDTRPPGGGSGDAAGGQLPNVPETFAEAHAVTGANLDKVGTKKLAVETNSATALSARSNQARAEEDGEASRVFSAPPFWARRSERDTNNSDVVHHR